MKIGIFYNFVEEVVRGFDYDKIAENEILATVEYVREALAPYHTVIPVQISRSKIPQIVQYHFDLVFNLCEGIEGDVEGEALMAALLDLLQIPYTGSNYFTLALCLDKVRTKQLLQANHISTPNYQLFRTPEDLLDSTLIFPLIVKPVHEDASIGITIDSVVQNTIQLRHRVSFVLDNYHQPALVEEFIDGREINVALLGNGDQIEAFPLSEIIFDLDPSIPHIVDYESKWVEDSYMYKHTNGVCPAQVNPECARNLVSIAIQAYKITSCRDYARVDFRLKGEVPFVLEVNPNPGINKDSGFYRSARVAQLSYEQMILKILTSASQRYQLPLSSNPDQKVKLNPFFCSNHLCFYPITLQNIPKLHQWFNDPQISQYMADPDTPITEAQLITDFILLDHSTVDSEGIYLLITEKVTGVEIGYCAIYDITPWNQSAEISFLIGESSYHHRGFGSEIVHSLVQIAFTQLNLVRLEATATEKNIPSWKALENAGFQKIGRISQAHRLHGLYMDDFLYECLKNP